ncbi:MAG: lipid A export permease/ATP-binding protein MsbA [Gammaproteobacteria bacterium]|nr:lipid A export permease/ATP-binding protein MsbA [Gammaproteobacteria bacterium]
MNKNDIVLYKRLLGYVKPYWKIVIVMIIATAIFSTTNAAYVSQLKSLIDDLNRENINSINNLIGLLMVVTIVRGVASFISGYTMRRISSDIVLNLRKDMFEHLQRLPSKYFDSVNTGKTISRFNHDVGQVTSAATKAVIILVREGVLVVALLSYLIYKMWDLTLLIFVLAPFIAIIVKVISKRLRKLAEGIQTNMGTMNHVLDENIKGHKIVKIYAAQEQEKKKFNSTIRHVRNAAIKSVVATSSSTPIIEMLIVSVISAIILMLSHRVVDGLITTGEMVTYIAMIGLLPSPIKKLLRINEDIQRGIAASKSIFGFLDETAESNTLTSPVSMRHFNGDLTFKNVSFAYGDEPVLSNFNLSIHAGETVALVGASGSGKSSLASLIPRFYDINSGSIELDGTDTREMDLTVLRKQIAFVNQEIVLFDASVISNIAYGDNNVNIENVKKAAQSAHADEFITEMEDGYQSQIGESGQRLSGGQKQRLAIARAIYKNAPIIILDEATSALDSESEKKVQMALDELMHDRTAIVIAHRLSTVKNADRILVLDNGAIVEQGTHKELVEKKGRYYNLHNTLS